MAKDLNKVQLTGNLGKDPETRYTAQGSALTRFSVASSRRWHTPEGDDRDETEWFTVVAWNKLGEICAQYLQKGARVYIEGRLQTRSWDDKDGKKRYSTDIVADRVVFLSSGGAEGGGGAEPFPATTDGAGGGADGSSTPGIEGTGARSGRAGGAALPEPDAATMSLKSCGEVATRSASSNVIRPACRCASRCWSKVCMP